MEKHLRYLNPEIPIHFTRYFPAYLTSNPPTPISLLEEVVNQAREAGISYPYIGNVFHRFENTFCPEYATLLIRRSGHRVIKNRLLGRRCYSCGRRITVVLDKK